MVIRMWDALGETRHDAPSLAAALAAFARAAWRLKAKRGIELWEWSGDGLWQGGRNEGH
jgi:hypothetical protein